MSIRGNVYTAVKANTVSGTSIRFTREDLGFAPDQTFATIQVNAESLGGGSFAVFVLFDGFSPPNAGRLPTIEANTLIRNLGGNGGDGGNGGAGGDPGAGALGGPLAAFNGPSFCVFPGAKGGFGARGGHGGGGGGGCGGLSFDLFVWGTGLTLPYSAANTFPIPPSSATGGRGGSGGNSPNPVVGVGTSGVDGAAGNVGVQP
jgi:hypothetical protein